MMKVVEFIQYTDYWKGKHKNGSTVCLSQVVLFWKYKVLAQFVNIIGVIPLFCHIYDEST